MDPGKDDHLEEDTKEDIITSSSLSSTSTTSNSEETVLMTKSEHKPLTSSPSNCSVRSCTLVPDMVSTAERRLTLAYEALAQIPQNFIQDYAPIIEILDLSHNNFSSVEFLSHFPSLTTLILDHNMIHGETLFPPLPLLRTLWLNHNSVANLHPFIPKLGEACPKLGCLSLMGNVGAPSYLNGGTYYQYLQYRLFVISWMSCLEYLDDRKVTSDQRQEAQRLYGRKIYRSLKQSLQPLQQYNPTKLLKMVRHFFFSESSESSSSSSNQNFFGEGRTLEENDITEDSSSSSLNNLSDFENVSYFTEPNFTKLSFAKKKPRNLVI